MTPERGRVTKDAVVVVSGGSRGLGQAIVAAMLAEGCKVATFSRSRTPFIAQLVDDPALRDAFHWQALDAIDHAGVKAFAQQVQMKFGRIDVLINNAGVNLDQVLAMTQDEEIDNLLSLNLASVIKLSRQVSRVMLARGGGNIINISSVIGTRGFKGTSVYSATKAALDGLSRSLARELGARGIRVNSIAPGFLATDMTGHMPAAQKAQILRRTPLGRLGEAADVVGLIKYLISDDASFITGQTFVVDGGLTC
jgi:3-oxoacyl-[acyl-carrier protein] reductase